MYRCIQHCIGGLEGHLHRHIGIGVVHTTMVVFILTVHLVNLSSLLTFLHFLYSICVPWFPGPRYIRVIATRIGKTQD